MKVTFLIFSLLFMTACFGGGERPLRTASFVDVNRYLGKWYAIEALPQFFTRKCLAQTAEYELLDEKSIKVLNTCLKKKGKSTISGKAVVKNEASNAELIVTFDNFFTRLFRVKGDYTIIDLDPNYDHVLVGSKDRKSLWILAREKQIDERVRDYYVKIAEEEGFPVDKLVPSQF